MRCKKCPMAKDECCTICDQNDFLTAERPLPDQDELLAALKRERTINQQLNAIIENSADTLFVTNGNGDVIKVNRAWEQLSQTNREDVLGRNIRDLVSTVISDSSTLATLETKQRATKEQHLLRSGRTSYTTSTPVFTDGVLTMTSVRSSGCAHNWRNHKKSPPPIVIRSSGCRRSCCRRRKLLPTTLKR